MLLNNKTSVVLKKDAHHSDEMSRGAATSGVSPYAFEMDSLSEADWHALLVEFEDATLYQTWSYGAVRWGPKRMHRAILRRNGVCIAMAQIAIYAPPGFSKGGIAYVPHGPLIKRRDAAVDYKAVTRFLSELHRVFVNGRGMVLRLAPYRDLLDSEGMQAVLIAGGFKRRSDIKAEHTLLMDLSHPLEDLRKGMKKSWRANLVRAERSDFLVLEGTDTAYFAIFLELYRQMMARKRFSSGVDPKDFLSIQERLPPDLKMRIWVCCRPDGVPLNAAVCSIVGGTAINVLCATGDMALTDANGSYLLQWRILEWLKRYNIRFYDLDGIDPSANPNVYRFKAGLVGSCGRELHHMGVYEAGGARMSGIIRMAEQVRALCMTAQRIVTGPRRV